MKDLPSEFQAELLVDRYQAGSLKGIGRDVHGDATDAPGFSIGSTLTF